MAKHAAIGFLVARIVLAGTYDFNVGWKEVNPDSRQPRQAIVINGQWPNPTIRVQKGDTLQVHVNNQLGSQSTSLHWHGIHQNGSNQYDGPPGVVQCPIPPGMLFTYEFQIDQPGTYWYHSHSPGQYMDGLRGPLIVDDPDSPYNNIVDEELHPMTLSDWYHDQMPSLLDYYLSLTANPDGSEPEPYSLLMNDGQAAQFMVKPSKTYMLRVINMSGFSQVFLAIDQHNMTIIEADGIYTQPREVQHLYVATAQRYSVLIRTHTAATQNFAILAMLDTGAFDSVPSYVDTNVTGHLVYDADLPLPASPSIPVFHIIDDLTLAPYTVEAALAPVDHEVSLDLSFFTAWDENRAGFNNISWIPQLVPSLYTALSAPPGQVDDLVIYGPLSNSVVLEQNEVVEVTITNFDNGYHPIHLHGHQPQIISRSITPTPSGSVIDPSGPDHSATNPMRRDTFMLAPLGITTIRFQADNPGVWLMHCHMEWHAVAGLTMTFIEAPQQLQAQQAQIAPGMQELCAAQNISIRGNAGGNTRNWTDASNAPTQPSGQSGALYP